MHNATVFAFSHFFTLPSAIGQRLFNKESPFSIMQILRLGFNRMASYAVNIPAGPAPTITKS